MRIFYGLLILIETKQLSEQELKKMSTLIAPDPFTDAEIRGAQSLRKRLSHILPPTFDTDFFLARWYRAYNGDLDGVEKYLGELISHRQTLGYNEKNIFKCCSEFDFAKKTFERFAISTLDMVIYSNDVGVFLQTMKGVDLKEILRVIPLGHIINSYFLLQECFHRAITAHEQKTGRPTVVVVVIDLSDLILSDFLNPLSAPSKLARFIVKIWSDYFSESLTRLYLVNPPGIVSLMWQITKHIVDAKTQTRINFITKLEDLHNFLPKEAFPISLSGSREDKSGFGSPETCVSIPKPVTPDDYFNSDEVFWKPFGISPSSLKPQTISLKTKSVHEIEKVCSAGQKLLWLFTVNGDIGFEIIYKLSSENASKKERHIWPKVILTSLKTPEHGYVEILESGNYKLRFKNSSTGLFSGVKLVCTVEIV